MQWQTNVLVKPGSLVGWRNVRLRNGRSQITSHIQKPAELRRTYTSLSLRLPLNSRRMPSLQVGSTLSLCRRLGHSPCCSLYDCAVRDSGRDARQVQDEGRVKAWPLSRVARLHALIHLSTCFERVNFMYVWQVSSLINDVLMYMGLLQMHLPIYADAD